MCLVYRRQLRPASHDEIVPSLLPLRLNLLLLHLTLPLLPQRGGVFGAWRRLKAATLASKGLEDEEEDFLSHLKEHEPKQVSIFIHVSYAYYYRQDHA